MRKRTKIFFCFWGETFCSAWASSVDLARVKKPSHKLWPPDDNGNEKEIVVQVQIMEKHRVVVYDHYKKTALNFHLSFPARCPLTVALFHRGKNRDCLVNSFFSSQMISTYQGCINKSCAVSENVRVRPNTEAAATGPKRRKKSWIKNKLIIEKQFSSRKLCLTT